MLLAQPSEAMHISSAPYGNGGRISKGMLQNGSMAGKDTTAQKTAKRILWFSAVSADPACQGTHGYLRLYQVAVASSRAVGNHAFLPHLIVHVPEDVAWSSVNETVRATIDGLQSSGVTVIQHTLSITQHLKNLNKYDACNDGAYLRIDIPQIMTTNGMDRIPDIDPKFVLYTDMDIVWREPISLSEWEQMLPTKKTFKYSVETHKGGKRPLNTGVMIVNVEKFASIHDEFVKFGVVHDFKFTAFDQGWINAFSDAFGENELLTNTWNWKVYWGNSPGVKLVHFHGPKPGKGLDCFAKHIKEWKDICDMPDVYRRLLKLAIAADGGEFAKSVIGDFDKYEQQAGVRRSSFSLDGFDWQWYATKRHPNGYAE